MNIKAFFTDALGQALELGIGTPDDVLRHVTPDVLAAYLPKPLWARLFTACLGAARVDAQLVVETIGVPNLCEHVPTTILWQCISEIAQRSLGQAYVAPPPIVTRRSTEMPAATPAATPPVGSMLAPPPEALEAPVAQGTSPGKLGPSIPPVNEPLADLITELEQDERPITPSRGRTPTSQRFRQSNTGIGRLGASQTSTQRRPQAQASAAIPSVSGRPRRTGTEVEDVEEAVREREIAVDDSQLVDWQSTETTEARSDEDFSDLGRKR